ncbi:sodium/hydrogen exchanger 9B2-like [Dendronephthya gigantea]|uniref:sodium/hydrogen exchanger 9B2-like n=1 Tax=Dendronephthya gigantea TaxID=151771 RepID=UPI00106D803E|nr:sodium/hydrogen exchanger 9B2-like [Dendronephthya gigantea]
MEDKEKDLEIVNENEETTSKYTAYVNKFNTVFSGKAGAFVTAILLGSLIWTALLTVTKSENLPGGNLFGLFVVFVCSLLLGALLSRLPFMKLPKLLGMLLAGLLLTNIEAINVVQHIDKSWSVSLRNIALVVILLRSGLELDPVALKKLKRTVIALAFGPCIIEALTVAVVTNFLLELPWLWGLQLGFVLGAVSPAIVVPQLLKLQEQGFGVNEGIPTLVMAASSCDDVLAISLFAVFLGIAYSTGDLIFNIFRGPLEILLGITLGCFSGFLLSFIPSKHEPRYLHEKRFTMLLSLGVLLLFGSNWIQLSGAGALAVLTTAFVAAHGWKENGKLPVVKSVGKLWIIFEPLMFGLIGAEVKMEYMTAQLIGRGIATLVIGLILRVFVTYLVTFGNDLKLKERLFICIAWLPKATVQAAIGAISLETAREQGFSGKPEEDYGKNILTLAVLVILLTAPLGAVGIAVTGPRLLRREANVVNPVTSQEEQIGLTEDTAVL